MKTVLIDTNILIANISQNEQKHSEAKQLLDDLTESKSKLYISRYILEETFTRTRAWYPYMLSTVIEALTQDIQNGRLNLLEITQPVWEQAKEVLLKYDKIKLSFTDCTTYALYKHLKLDEICTFDQDFTKLKANTTKLTNSLTH